MPPAFISRGGSTADPEALLLRRDRDLNLDGERARLLRKEPMIEWVSPPARLEPV